MKILVLNAGSSSIKFQLFRMMPDGSGQVLAAGLVERIGEAVSGLKYTRLNGSGEETETSEQPVPDHDAGLRLVIAALSAKDTGVIASTAEIDAVGHRVVHGGEEFHAPSVIDDAVLEAIERNSPLAPLHNPPNLTGIRVARALIPGALQVAVFDTAFHQSMPEEAFMYALPYELYTELKVRRYGFHGTSHGYVAAEAARLLGKPLAECNLITAHLGNGASMAAVLNGKCVDTSLGMTPLAGLVMGTRTGDFDPAILFYLAERKGLGIPELDDLVNKQSGLKGLCGYNDLRDIHARIAQGDKRASLALKLMTYRNKKYVGAYFAVLGRVDAIVFTAGVGENDSEVRRLSLEGLEHLGVVLDAERNAGRCKESKRISADSSTVQVWVIPTNEELEIARQTFALAGRTNTTP